MIRPLAEARGGIQLWLVELNGERAVTRLFGDIPQQLGLEKAIEGLAFGRLYSAGLPSDLTNHLTGYAERSRLDPTLRLPVVLAAGLARDPARPGVGAPFVTAAWVEGEPLTQAAKALAPAALAQTLLDVLEVLASLHAQDVVYGDLKPDNVIVNPAGAVHLIDLETVRRVPASDHAVKATALTPPYAAPEIEKHHLIFLASDIYAFGVTASRLLGVAAPPRWPEAITACLAQNHAERPSARALLQHLHGSQPLPKPPAPERTIRVADLERPAVPTANPPELRLDEIPSARPSAPLPKDVLSAEITAEITAPQPPPAIRGRTRSWPLWLVFLGLLVGTWAVGSRVYKADELAESAAADLKWRQTDPAVNEHKGSLDAVYKQAQVAVNTWKSSKSTSIFALVEVLESKWHYEGADWDPLKWERDLAAVNEALEYGENADNRLAAAYLYGGACWRSTDDPKLRDKQCEKALQESENAARLAQPGWQTLEAMWVRTMTFSHRIARLEDGSFEQAQLLDSASQACLDAPAAAQRGVNGIFLLKECLRIHGRARRLEAYLVAANAYLDLAERQGEGAGEARATVLWSVDPVCGESKKNKADVAMTRLQPSRPSDDDRGQRIAFCRLLGAKALGCELPNPEDWRPCARFSFDYNYWYGSQITCSERATHPNIPWDEALALVPIRVGCPVPE